MFWNQNFKPVSSGHVISPIENHKCPKNAKNACADALISPHCRLWWKRLCTGNPTQIIVFWRCKNFPELKVSTDLKQEQCLCVIDCDISPWASFFHSRDKTVGEYHLEAKHFPSHAFLAFLGHLLFWMGMIKVFRWNGLEILILKHMWKYIIGPLEQI